VRTDYVQRFLFEGLGRNELESTLAERGEVVIRNGMSNRECRFDHQAIEAIFA
jgi:hypothetical protein